MKNIIKMCKNHLEKLLKMCYNIFKLILEAI